MKTLQIEISDTGAIQTSDGLGRMAFPDVETAKQYTSNWIDGLSQDPPARPVAELVSTIADFFRRFFRSVNGADALFLGYLIAAIFTFGVVASSHKPTGEDSRVERVSYGIAGAIGWPLYWSWRICEGKQAN